MLDRTMRMRRFLVLASGLSGLLLIPAAPALADRFWALQLSGGNVVLSLDPPEERGSVIVFHRHPDGMFSSLRAGDVRRITMAQGPAKKTARSLDGVVLVFGRDAEAPDPEAWRQRPPQPSPEAPSSGYDDVNGAFSSSGFAAGTPHSRHRRHGRPFALARPNGFPVVFQSGSAGGETAIGSNGFPDLFPTPPPSLPFARPLRRR